MPSRESTAARLSALRGELALVTEFCEKWEALTEFTLATFTQSAITLEEIERFDAMRGELNRLLPRVRGRLGNTVVIREQFGHEERVDSFGFLLEGVPHLGSFAQTDLGRGGVYREFFFETRTRTRSALQQAMGQIDREIVDVEASSPVVDSLAEQAERVWLPGFLSHVENAESSLSSGAFDDAIHSSRRAVERLATETANVVTKTPRKRQFKAAMDTLKQEGLVDEATHRSIVTPKVGFWGWASEIGTHDEADPEGGFEAGAPEARLAIERARAIAEYLLARLALYLAAENDKHSRVG